MLKNLLKNKKRLVSQSQYIDAISGLGDIFVFETKRRNKNKKTIKGIERIVSLLKSLFEIKETHPERFNELVYRSGEYNFSFSVEEDSPGFSEGLNQIFRIHEAALEVGNEEISRSATYHLIGLLGYLSVRPNNELFIELILKVIVQKFLRKAVEKQDISMYAATTYWYVDVVFRVELRNQREFDLSYLGVFNKYFIVMAKYLVSENLEDLFKEFISSLLERAHIPIYDDISLFRLSSRIDLSNSNSEMKNRLINEVFRYKNELEESLKYLENKEDFDEWNKKLNEFDDFINLHLSEENREESLEFINGQMKTLRDRAVISYKHSSLLELVFGVGAFCLFKKNYKFISQLWEYKQPKDSDATWVGHDIVLLKSNEIMEFYFNRGSFRKEWFFWEDRHGASKYFKEYFLVLLLRDMERLERIPGEVAVSLGNLSLPSISIYRLSDMRNSIESLVNVAEKLKNEKELFRELDFDEEMVPSLVEYSLIPFLKSLAPKIDQKIKNIHREKKISAEKSR